MKAVDPKVFIFGGAIVAIAGFFLIHPYMPDVGPLENAMTAEIEATPIVQGNAGGSLHRQPDGHVGGVHRAAQADGEDRRAQPARSSSDHSPPPSCVRTALVIPKSGHLIGLKCNCE